MDDGEYDWTNQDCDHCTVVFWLLIGAAFVLSILFLLRIFFII